MTPTIGRIVHYTLGEGDVTQIHNQRLAANLGSYLYNDVRAGDVYPALVVRVFAPSSSTANLQVFLDGVDSHWATSRTEGEGEGHWIWPPRVEAPAPATA